MAACALWMWYYGSLDVTLYDDEAEAADAAVSIEDRGEGSCAGVQFPDGSFIDRDFWNAWDEAQDRRREAEKAEVEWCAKMRAGLPPPRRIKAPFGDRVIAIPADYPSWVGTPVVG
jgi:hypothetical protein